MTIPVEPGEIIGGKYEILGRIGKGGMGVVFEARHATVGRRLAIKFLRSDVPIHERKLLRFQREARACGALHHENVAAVLDLATDHLGRPYIVMELVDGLSLRELLEAHGPLGVKRSCNLICQAARGLSAAHQAGILHRDLKPENLMVTRRGDGSECLKLLDFGVARLTEDETTALLTREGEAPGTPHYLSPEIARGESSASVQSDIYSLGVVLFELLTGERPHAGDNDNAVIHQIAQHPARLIKQLKPKLATPIAQVIDRTLCQDPTARPQSALEFVEALQSACGDEPLRVEAATVTSSYPVKSPSGPSSSHVGSASPSVGPVDNERRGSQRGVAGRAGSVVVLMLIAGAPFAILALRPASSVELDQAAPTETHEEPPRPKAPASGSHGLVRPPPTPAPIQVRSALPELPRHPPAPRLREQARIRRAVGTSGSPAAPGSSAAPEPLSSTPTHGRAAVPVGSFDRENPFRD